LFCIGAFLLFSILLAMGGPENGMARLFALPGSFLFASFAWPAFYVPLYFFSSAVILLKQGFRSDLLFALNGGILPFLTFSLGARLLLSKGNGFYFEGLKTTFGHNGAVLLLFLLGILETILIIQLTRRIFQKNDVPRETTQANTAEEDHAEEDHIEENREGVFEPVSLLEAVDDDFSENEKIDLELGDPPLTEDDYPQEEAEEEPEEVFEEEEPEEVFEEEEQPGPEMMPGRSYAVPVDALLDEYPDGQYWKIDQDTQDAGDILRNTLQEFKIQAEVTGIRKGPVITMFEILPAPGVKLSKIVNLSDNIALRLAASSVRIVAPIPGKHAVGIEVPNKKRSIVSFKEMVSDDVFQEEEMELPVALGKDITGEAQILDLCQTPHLLIAGATGSGKSVCVNSIICSILYNKSPGEARLMLIDPKIVELKLYNDVPHLLTPVITDPKRAFQALQYCLYEMERRYALLDSLGVRDISAYNRKIRKKRLATEQLPYIVIIVDEFADLMATSGKELESTLARLAAMSRAVGLHLVLATQRPSIDVITGLIKANIPSRIAFMVASKFDSRIIIDSIGAEKLLGKGDLLFTSPWEPFPVRIQGAYLSEDEVVRITDHVKTLGTPEYIDEEIFAEDDGDEEYWLRGDSEDPLTEKAIEIVVEAGKASASYLQRRLKIGYNRAARLVEDMEARGIVGPQNGSKPREILSVHALDNTYS
jgi:DNA segregation ATPase FtsK/SpoIIIE, S-DNA-T family